MNKSKTQKDILVAGAGAAGLMASIAAAAEGGRVTVCEQLDRPGCKLLATGGGRCNLTNTLPVEDFIAPFVQRGRFMLPALRSLDENGLRRFFEKRGVYTHSPDGLRVFLKSDRSGDILHALLEECRKRGVIIRPGIKVRRLLIAAGRVHGVVTDRGKIPAECVILATGGRSYPALGGTGGGYALAAQAGHTIVEPVPALVGLITGETWSRSCAGVTLPDVRLRVDAPRRRGSRESATGSMVFTHAGISGPAALDISGTVSRLLLTRDSVPLCLNLLPEFSVATWRQRFNGWHHGEGNKQIKTLLSNYLPFSIVKIMCLQAGNIGTLRASQLTSAHRNMLLRRLTACSLTVTATAGFAKAMVTSGGVALDKVDPRTLQSRLVQGLYFGGELLDIDGPCGGFNLQWAFSSGWLAGRSAARTLHRKR